ncbi:MAG: ATP-binding protein, partial [Deltaproteobacteria bacterium]
LLKAMVDNWQGVFRYVLGHVERSYVGELIDVRNKWAHEKPFTSDDVYRALDTMQRLLEAISEGERAEAIGRLKADLQRQVFAEQARNKVRYKQLTIEGTPKKGLKPWREVITPHQDVASGRYMQAEFAADLAQVHRGEGSDEYRDPHEFFRRTFITSGLRDLLSGALRRIAGKDGDPVVELQTNFGGGKTHSMLALYHLFSGVQTGSLSGIEPVLKEAGVDVAPRAHRAVLVGTALSPGQPSRKEDGTEVRTLWGEMAWQLGGRQAYTMIEDSDRTGTSPGSHDLVKLFDAYSPALVLIDEWVAYARQLVAKEGLPAGTFEAQGSFAQALTEAAKAAERTLVVASIPASKIEIGGTHGEYALEVLKNVFTRVGKPWRPATSDEGFEIVRRRLFEPISGKDNFAARDATINAFAKMYRDHRGEFPSEAAEGRYLEDLRSSYPFHPELFRRLYDDWSTLDKFQRTRGVLRLLAKVVHRLWESQDGGLLIMPASVPMDDHAVKSELTRYLDDVWEPIISQDVDGPNSMPLALDQEIRHLGRYSACRRVARALYIGTAPGAKSTTPGVGAERLRLACAQPGETVATFGDALRRISEKGQYIHQDGNRYWLSTRPNLNRTAEDRAAALAREPEDLYAELVRRLAAENDKKNRGDFVGVHVCPQDTAAVPDEPTARLVILGPQHSHKRGRQDSRALEAAAEFLDHRGGSPRINRNTLVFLAADEKELDSLLEATASFLAWRSILEDKQSLNLDQFQLAQAESKVEELDRTVDLRIGATWIHALVPVQLDSSGEVTWEVTRIPGNGSLAKRTSAKLVLDEALLPKLGGIRLRMTLDRYLWSDRNHVTLGELAEWFPRYLYLPRIKDRDTLVAAVEDGAGALVIDDAFVVAEAFDEASGRYLGLRVDGGGPSVIDNDTCIVKPDVACKQQAEDERNHIAGISPAPPAADEATTSPPD